MGSISPSSPPFSVIIVGAGIAELASAIPISRRGHSVTVLESKPGLNEFGASIGILPSGVKILKAFGLESVFLPVVTREDALEVRDGASNKILGRVIQNAKSTSSILYGGEVWHIHRADYQQVLATAAQKYGTRIIFNTNVKSVDPDSTTVHLDDGSSLQADLIVGADGMRSAVRHSIPATSDVEPKKLFEDCFRCTVPKDRMENNPKLSWLLTNNQAMFFTSPGRYVLSWPLPPNRPYDVVTCILRESHVPPGHWGIRADPSEMAKHFDQFSPEIRELLANVDDCMQWALGELPPMQTFRSDNGRVMLLGDAAHAQIPHSASGGNSAIEDGACIGECLHYASKCNKSIADATAAFETIRKPRVERMQLASHDGYGFLSAGGEGKEQRDAFLGALVKANEEELKLPVEERKKKPLPPADMNAPFPTPPYLQWLYGYDAIAETRRWCEENM